ncbi:MAG: HlyC/CorC family transporter [Chloroflexi bacterium]|nr:HlyC/CorC family transporter [Chloroflexota bacterium]
MSNDVWPGIVLLVAALVLLAFVVAAETGVIAGFRARARAMEPRDVSRLEALQRYAQERQVTLASLALARNLTIVGITAIVVFLVLDGVGHHWSALAVAAFVILFGLMLFQALPRLLVSQDPERWDRYLRPFVSLVRTVFALPARLLDLPVAAALRWWRRRHEKAADEAEQILRLAELEEATGAIPAEEREMIRGIMEMEQTMVKEIMVPRIDIVGLESDAGFEEVARLIVERGYSRLPVYEETIDNIIGVIHAREVLKHLAKGTSPASIKELVRPAYFVPESKRVDDLLSEMREQKISIAIVADEYGGTAGLVTIEDLLEEIVGEIADEFDEEEEEVQRLNESEAIVDARVSIDDLNELFGLEIERNDFDTVGGCIYDQLGKMPSVGDEVRVDGLLLRVLSVSGRRIKKVRVIREEPPPAQGEEGNNHPRRA